jgi:CRP-like cAMP-binding protein
MQQSDLYNKLAALPLFMGMSRSELALVIAQIKFEIINASRGETIITEGEKGGRLLLLAGGEAEMVKTSDDRSYAVTEWVKAPAAIQPEHTFGLAQRYTCTLKAGTACNLLSISKTEALKLTDQSLIFRLNLLNMLSTTLQKRSHDMWRSTPHTLEDRICRFLTSHCTHPGGRKIFKIKMVRLAEETNASRLQVSQALNHLQDKGLIKLFREKIEISSIELLSGSR